MPLSTIFQLYRGSPWKDEIEQNMNIVNPLPASFKKLSFQKKKEKVTNDKNKHIFVTVKVAST